MGVKTYTKECELGVSASRVFKAMVLDDHNFLPKVLPQGFKSIDIVHGDGGVGTIKQINFGESKQQGTALILLLFWLKWLCTIIIEIDTKTS